jgi:hypothetical protein
MRKQTQLLIAVIAAFFLVLGSNAVFSQGVTTSAIEGTVLNITNEPLSNANVVAVHTPSGTRYGAVSRADGRFNLPNLRTGGPYEITVSYVGYQSDQVSNIYLALGETRSLVFFLIEVGVSLEEVVIAGMRDRVFDAGRTGATTNLDTETINMMPTISRSINDFTRLNPQSNGSSFAGRDNRFNNYTIDGNIYNNNFGLGSGQFAGTNPISVEAIEEIQVNIAPYDVRAGGFTGANVNAITKSGTNEFRGSAYGYYRNESFLGTKIGEQELTAAEAFTRTIGASVGGPIIRDRLFFFVSVEQEAASNPGDQRLATRPGLPPDGQNVTRVPADRMDFVRDRMNSIYSYETGPYEGYDFGDEGLRLNFRLDFNISQNHRLAVRLNHYDAFRDITINGNSVRNVTRYSNTNRFGNDALTFRNANYSNDNVVTSFMAELNSVIGNRFANSLNIGYTSLTDPKRGVPGGQVFPFVEVLEWDGNHPGQYTPEGTIVQGTPRYYFALGNELFTVGNLLANDVFNITNNFSAFLGRHTITAGFNFEYQMFENAFNPNAHTFYRFNSYQNFLDVVINRLPDARPDGFAFSYSYQGPDDLPMDETAFAQAGVYFQDKFQVNPDFVVTAGLRVDVPFFPIDLPSNPRLDAMNVRFTNPRTGAQVVPDVGTLPSGKPLFSPRIAFNYDVFGDNTLQLRGGTGFFSGRIPFVWISNQVSANGVTRGFDGWDRYRLVGGEWVENKWGEGGRPAWNGFQADPAYYKPDPSQLQAQVSRDINLTDLDFKFPQVWRTNLAADYRLPNGIIATLEGIYNQDYNSPLAININLAQPAGRFGGADPRPYFTSYTQNNDFNEVMLLTNINEGYYASLTAQLQKDFENGVYASIAYTRSVSKDYGLIGGSQAASLWPQVVKEDRNNPEMGYSRFDQPNRIVSYVSYNTRKLTRRLPTSIALFYSGGEAGRFSYTYAGNFGDRASRLMYIPNSANEITLLPVTIAGTAYSPEQQWNILNNFIEQDDYLSQNRGQVAERNGALLPWLHRFDLRITQDIAFTNLPNRHKLQITFDVLNFGNMLNSEWGVQQTAWIQSPLTYAGRDANTNLPTYRLTRVPGGPAGEIPQETYRSIISLNQTWSAQIGVRYMF